MLTPYREAFLLGWRPPARAENRFVGGHWVGWDRLALLISRNNRDGKLAAHRPNWHTGSFGVMHMVFSTF